MKVKVKKLFLTWIIPSKHNQYWPRFIRHRPLRWYSLGLIILQLILGVTLYSGPSVTAEEGKILTQQIVEYTNKARVSKDLPVLLENPKLNEAALNKANDMFQKNYWDHISPDGKDPWTFISNTGYKYSYAGENLARGFDNASSVFEAWMQSPTHKDNILSKNYKDIGIGLASGVLDGKPTTVVVQLFATPLGVEAAPTGTEPTKAVLAANPKTIPQVSIKNTTWPSKMPYLLFWVMITLILAIDALLLKRAGILHKHRFHFNTSVFLSLILLVILIIGFVRIM